MAITTGAAALLAASALTKAGSDIYGAKKQAGANKQATEVEGKAAQEALAFERDKETRRRQEYDAMIAAEKAAWEAEQARESPYRAASLGILGQSADRLGLNLGALGGYSPTTSTAGASSAMSPTSASGYPSGSLGSLAGYTPTALSALPEPEALKFSLADLMKMKSAGDWRTGRTA